MPQTPPTDADPPLLGDSLENIRRDMMALSRRCTAFKARTALSVPGAIEAAEKNLHTLGQVLIDCQEYLDDAAWYLEAPDRSAAEAAADPATIWAERNEYRRRAAA